MRFNGIIWDAMHAIVQAVFRQLLIAMPCVECMRTYVARGGAVPDAVVVIKLAIWIVRIPVVICSDRLAVHCHCMVTWMQSNYSTRKLARKGVLHICLKLLGLSAVMTTKTL